MKRTKRAKGARRVHPAVLALRAVEHVVFDDFCNDLEMRDDLTGDLKTAREKILQIYRIAHSHRRGRCYGSHGDWRKETKEFLKLVGRERSK